MELKKRLEWFHEREIIMLFLWEEHFLNPLIPSEMEKLNLSNFFNDIVIWDILDKNFPKFLEFLPSGMYFPVPICKLIKQGKNFFPKIALKFHYNFIKIDENQMWSLQNNRIKGKILKLFKSNLLYEKSTNLYFIEYRSDGRWDKCYLQCEITPMLALNLIKKNDELVMLLNNNKFDTMDLHRCRIDHKERCFVKSKNFGEIMLADSPRFLLLNNLEDNSTNFVFEGEKFSISFS